MVEIGLSPGIPRTAMAGPGSIAMTRDDPSVDFWHQYTVMALFIKWRLGGCLLQLRTAQTCPGMLAKRTMEQVGFKHV